MSGINERISEIIKRKKIKKTEFAQKINVSQAFVSQLCSGASQPSDRTIADICRVFDVNEEWLRTGEGEMFLPLTRSEKIAKFAGRILRDESPSFQRRLVELLAELDTEEWEILERFAQKLPKKMD